MPYHALRYYDVCGMYMFAVLLSCRMNLISQNEHYGVNASTGAINYTCIFHSAHNRLPREIIHDNGTLLALGGGWGR